MLSSKIFGKILERNIEQFVGHFSDDSSVIYKDEKNKLIHPGEYGKYREESCKQLLRLMLNRNWNLSDGFVITADDRITTQCDIIIYNSLVSPLIADDISRMFPSEEVRAIIEIKSNLSKEEYKKALKKMAENKKIILDGRKGEAIRENGTQARHHDTIGSFLICNKLNFDCSQLDNEEIYGDIDRKYWHNGVLSIENGVFAYLLEFDKFPTYVVEKLFTDGMNTDIHPSWEYPFFCCGEERVCTRENFCPIDEADKYRHIKKFLMDVCICCNEVWKYEYEPIRYLGMDISLFTNYNIENEL